MPNPVKFRGQWYPSMAAAARAHGLKPNTLHRAKWQGRLEAAGDPKRAKYHQRKRVEMNGLEFSSVKAAAEFLGVERSTILYNLKRGRDYLPGRGVPIEIEGRKWPSISACARDLGVSRAKVDYHLNRGTLSTLVPKKEFTHCINCGRDLAALRKNGKRTHGRICYVCLEDARGIDN